jgi:hypothetical protein
MRWNPTPEQISVAVDCAVARVPLEKAAELIGVRPRTLRSFSKRIGAGQVGQKAKGAARVADEHS